MELVKRLLLGAVITCNVEICGKISYSTLNDHRTVIKINLIFIEISAEAFQDFQHTYDGKLNSILWAILPS